MARFVGDRLFEFVMRIAILTTDTSHHKYFAWRLGQLFPIVGIFLETHRHSPKYSIQHPFEELRELYENNVLLASAPTTFDAIAKTYVHSTMNDSEAVSGLKNLEVDVALVFGTGKLHSGVLNIGIEHFLNLHGGNPEHYRGLDSHLWAIYHRDFLNLVTTLHLIEPDFDKGNIVLSKSLDIPQGSELHQLRGINTDACIELCVAALSVVEKLGHLPSRRQTIRGRYYSAMPSVLKDECIANFKRFADRS